MMESLAAATILATKWTSAQHFINPMCGSGTLAIEAALMASNKVPGLFRKNYSFMHVQGYDEEAYLDMLDDAKAERRSVKDIKIIATDISEDAIKISKINAGIAGVDHLIEFKVCDFERPEITDFKCLTKEMVANNQLTFEVKGSFEDDRTALYKFVKIQLILPHKG